MLINNQLLDKLASEAEKSARLRMNYILNNSPEAKAQRLIKVLLPGTVIPIHRNRHTATTYTILRGKIFVVFYDALGGQTERYLLDPAVGNYVVHIPSGQWYSVEIIEPSAILEVKDGPYKPLDPSDIMD